MTLYAVFYIYSLNWAIKYQTMVLTGALLCLTAMCLMKSILSTFWNE